MAIKVALAAALLVALVAVARATSYTTTVTTISMDEENIQSRRQCSERVQRQQFRGCQRFLQQRRSSPYADELEEEDLANPQQGSLQQCCQELKQMDRQQCGCEAIKHAVRQAQQQQQGGHSRYQTRSQSSEQMYQRARALPRRCGLRQQQCRFNLVFV